MAEDTRAQETAEETTQPAPMPSANQETSEPTATEPQAQSSEEGVLPQEASERTRKEFDKIKQQLADERTRRQYFESVYAQKQGQQDAEPLPPGVDPTVAALQQQVVQTQSQFQSYLQEQEDREAFAAHPELNPSDPKQFSQELHVAARRIYLDAMLNPQDYGGKQLNLKEAGDLAKAALQAPGAMEQAKREGAQEALTQLTPKEQASLGAMNATNGRQQAAAENHEQLRERSRKGDLDAIAARLKAIDGAK